MRNGRLFSSAADAIGDTPLVELQRLQCGTGGRILAKLENLNPGASKKDRIALEIINQAEASGALKPGGTVVELTSGNTGTGAAIVCAAREYKFIAVMSEGNSSERARMMRALGAEVILVPQAPGSVPGQVSGADLALVEEQTAIVTDRHNAFRIDQFGRKANADAHEFGTGPEIWQASGGEITAFCDFVGSGGTFAGLWRAFKGRNAAVRGYLVEPEQAAVLAQGEAANPNHRIQGGGYSMAHLPLLEGITPDGYLTVTDEDAMQASRRLAAEEGIFAGFSAGANVAAALKLLEGPEAGGTIAVIICDTGLKYLSTDLWV